MMFLPYEERLGALLHPRTHEHHAAVSAATLPLYQQHDVSMVPDRTVQDAIASDAVSRRVLGKGLAPRPGDLVGVRLNLNIMKSKRVPIQTVHAGNGRGGHRQGRGFYSGTVIDYRKVISLIDAYFNVNQSARDRICKGIDAKHPMGSIDGILTEAEPSFEGIEVRFNPHDVSLFVDMANRPIRWASDVTVYGTRAYVRGMVEYFTPMTAPARAGDSPCAVVFSDLP